MAKSTVSKLVPKVPSLPNVPGVSRRQQYSASTKNALIDVAQELFTDRGYSGTSLDAIVAGAEVTKGALYHHFTGKQALFAAVFERVEEASAQAIKEAMKGHKDPWDKALAGLQGFLQVVQQDSYRRIVVQDGPAVLGYERYHEQEERSAFAVMVDIVQTVLTEAEPNVEDEMTDTVSRIFFGALSAAGDSVADAETPEAAEAAAARVETILTFVLSGMRALSAQGIHLADLTEEVAAEESEDPEEPEESQEH